VAVPEEMRGMWVMRFSLASPQSIRNIVAEAARHNFNTLFVQVRGRGDAWYRSDLEPRAEALANQPKDFDPLALMIAEAHRRGLKVHAWINTYLTWTGSRPPKSPLHIVNAHPDWIARDKANRFQMNASASVEGVYVQPANPEVQEHLFRVFTDIARRYDVDGIHFDFVRYPDADYDFSDATLARFQAFMEPVMTESGRAAVRADKSRLACVHTFPKEWAAWRREQISMLVRRIADAVHRMKPWMQVSAAVFANAEDAFNDKGQDWQRWLAENCLDAVCPMAYSQDTDTVVRQIAQAVAMAGEKHVYAGLGAWRMTAAETASKIARVRALGVRGITLFSYDEMTDEGRKTQYLDYLSRSIFPSRAGVPGMRWRAPRETPQGGEGNR
jgi:uncharacterized lipoprotein YddW (UPF0748 family)